MIATLTAILRPDKITVAQDLLNIMSSHEYQAPDLASILKTLASLTPKSQQQVGEQSTQDPQPLPYVAAPLLPPYQQSWQPQVQTPASVSRSTSANNAKLIDPASITDWSSGLKCVMRTVAKHENLLHDIRYVGLTSVSL